MTFAPRFSPDSNKVVLSFAGNGRTNIYEMDFAQKEKADKLPGPAIDTSPSYSPDGNKRVQLW